MANVVNSTNNPAVSPINAYYKKIPLKRLVAKTVYYKLGYKETLEDNHGRSFTWTLPGLQPGVATPVVTGVPLAPAPVTSQGIVATLQEYARAFAASSFLGNTAIINADKMLEDQATQGGAYSLDQVCRNAIFSTANVPLVNQYFANFKTSAAGVATTDVFGLAEVRRLHGLLQNNNVPTWEDGRYAVVIDPAMQFDLTNASTGGGYLDLAKQNPEGIKNIKEAFKVEEDGHLPIVGEYAGAVIMTTSLQPTLPGAGASGQTLHQAVAFGDASFGVVDLDAERFKIFRKTAKDSGMWDITEQISIGLGYKFGFAAQNLSQDLVTPSNQRILTMAASTSLF